MAEELEPTGSPDFGESENPPRPKKKLPKPILLAGIIIPVLALAAFTSNLVVKQIFFPAPEPVKVTSVHSQVGEFYMITDLIINPAASAGRRHLLISLGLEYHDPLMKEELTRREPQIRDNLITLLAGQDATVLTDIRYRESIRNSLLKAVNYYIDDGEVAKLYFTKYVFQ
jgi:flagellar FliL protein